MANLYKVKVDVIEKSISSREEIINAESSADAKEKVINYFVFFKKNLNNFQ